MKFNITTVEGARLLLALLKELVSLFFDIKNAITNSNIPVEDKEALLKELEEMKLPEWNNL